MKRWIFLLIICFVFELPAREKAVRNKNTPLRSVCLLKSPEGSGSGFFTTVQGKDVLITNNHVILEMADVKILDVNGNQYGYDTVYASKTKDLAYIPLKRGNHADMPNLTVCAAPDRLPVNTKIAALGDSLGDGVIVETTGKFLGIGPDVIEVSSPFVPGNSGGPVITVSGSEVIGVATYCRIITRHSGAAAGSRFEANQYRPSVRRFATRIDQLNPEDFQPVTFQEIQQDHARYERIARTYRKITALDFSSRSALDRLILILQSHTQWTMPEGWHTRYMQEEARKKLNDLIMLRNLLNPQAPVTKAGDPQTGRKIQECWKKYARQTAIRSSRKTVRKCLVCNGFGKIREDVPQAALNPRRMQSDFIMRPCPACQQKGRIPFGKAVPFAVPPSDFCKQLAQIIKPEKKKFCGFSIGAEFSGFPGYFHAKKTKTVRSGLFLIVRFPGNHLISAAAETRFWLLGNILLRTDVLLPADPAKAGQWKSEAENEHADMKNVILRMEWKKKAPEYKMPFPALRSDCQPVRPVTPPRSAVGLNLTLQNIRQQQKNRLQREAAVAGIRQIRQAAEEDPFGIYYTVPHETGAAGEFLQITLLHAEYQTCAGLLLAPDRRESLFSGE